MKINSCNYSNPVNFGIRQIKPKEIKMPEIKVLGENFNVLNKDNYNLLDLRIIDAIKNSKGFKKFFKRYDCKRLELQPMTTEFTHHCDFDYIIGIVEPKLKEEYKNSHKSFAEKILDFFIPTKDIGEAPLKNVHLIYKRNEQTPICVKDTSYEQIMYRLLKKAREAEEYRQGQLEKQELRAKLNL